MAKEININQEFDDNSVEEYNYEDVTGNDNTINKFLFYCVVAIVSLIAAFKIMKHFNIYE